MIVRYQESIPEIRKWSCRSAEVIPGTSKDRHRFLQCARGSPSEIVKLASKQGFDNLYIDGGKTIQNFLKEDSIEELFVTEIPLLLGGGDRLFGQLEERLPFEFIDTEILLEQLVKKHYRRIRD